MATAPHTTEIGGHVWRSWTREIGPWTSEEYPGWEIIRASDEQGKTKFMVYGNKYEYHTSVTALDTAATYIAEHADTADCGCLTASARD